MLCHALQNNSFNCPELLLQSYCGTICSGLRKAMRKHIHNTFYKSVCVIYQQSLLLIKAQENMLYQILVLIVIVIYVEK